MVVKRQLKKTFPVLYGGLHKLYWRLNNRLSRRSTLHPDTKVRIGIQELCKDIQHYSVDPKKPRVLFFVLNGNLYFNAIGTVLALRLRQRGSYVHFIECARTIETCLSAPVNFPDGVKPCTYCQRMKENTYRSFFPYSVVNTVGYEIIEEHNRIDGFNLSSCEDYTWQGVEVGRLVTLHMKWHLRRSVICWDDLTLYRDVLKAAVRILHSMSSALVEIEPDCIVMTNGTMFYERVVGALLKKKGIRFITYDHAYQSDNLYVGINTDAWNDVVHKEALPMRISLDAIERSNAQATVNSWIEKRGYQGDRLFHGDMVDLQEFIGGDERPFALLAPNMTFESSVIEKDRVFLNMFEWMAETIKYFTHHHEWRLIIRCHPAETRFYTAEPVEERMREVFDSLPENIIVISSARNVDTIALLGHARALLVYASTLGLEHSFRRRKAITAADTYYSGKGFTFDPAERQEYLDTLSSVMCNGDGMTAQENEQMLSYVYYFFFERSFQFEPVTMTAGTRYTILREHNATHLATGKCKGLEHFCNVICGENMPYVGRRSRILNLAKM